MILLICESIFYGLNYLIARDLIESFRNPFVNKDKWIRSQIIWVVMFPLSLIIYGIIRAAIGATVYGQTNLLPSSILFQNVVSEFLTA